MSGRLNSRPWNPSSRFQSEKLRYTSLSFFGSDMAFYNQWIKKPKHKNIGSNFDDFLQEEGVLADAEPVAVKRVVAYQIRQLMEKQRLSKKEMAPKMGTSRSALDRLLNPTNTSVSLKTLDKAAVLIGKKIILHLV